MSEGIDYARVGERPKVHEGVEEQRFRASCDELVAEIAVHLKGQGRTAVGAGRFDRDEEGFPP